MKYWRYFDIMRWVFILLIIKGVLLSAVLDSVKVKGVKIPFIYEEDKTLPIVGMQIVFKESGSLFDGKVNGLAKFTASMLQEGTKSLGAIGFAKRLEDEAINFNVGTGNETFVFEISSLKEQFSKGINLLSDLMQEPNFTQKSLNKVKLLKISSLEQKENDFDYLASLNLRMILFRGTPLAHPFIGTKESIKNISLKDVGSFYKNHIVLKRAVVVIGGDISKEDAKAEVKKVLSKLQVGESGKFEFYPTQTNPVIKELHKDTKQAYIYFGTPYNLRLTDEDAYKARVATFILGAGGFGSRLLDIIRVKNGLAYSVYASLNLNMTNSSMRGHLQTKLENQKRAMKLVKEVIFNFVRDGVTQDELDSAKKFLLGSEPLRNETLTQRLGRAFLNFYKGVELDYDKKVLNKIEKLSLKDLNDFIKSHDEINKLFFSIVNKKNIK